MRRFFVSMLLIAAVVAVRPALAQSPFSLEVTGVGALPTQTLGGADLKTGFGFGANLRYRFMPHLAAYGGWEWHHTRSDQLVAGRTTDVEDTGYTFGLRFEHPIATNLAYWVRAGGLYNHIELENDAGEMFSDSGHGLGWEVGGGVAVPITSRIALTPGVRYRTLTRDLEIGSTTRSSTLSYTTVGAGIAFTF